MTTTSIKSTLGQVIGLGDFDPEKIDFTDIQIILKELNRAEAITDLETAENLQQQTLRAANILSEYLSQIVKTQGRLESQMTAVKAQAALDYKDPGGGKVTIEMRKFAADASLEAKELSEKISSIKGAKVAVEKKYDIMIKAHHSYKDIASGLKKLYGAQGALGTGNELAKVTGWE